MKHRCFAVSFRNSALAIVIPPMRLGRRGSFPGTPLRCSNYIVRRVRPFEAVEINDPHGGGGCGGLIHARASRHGGRR